MPERRRILRKRKGQAKETVSIPPNGEKPAPKRRPVKVARMVGPRADRGVLRGQSQGRTLYPLTAPGMPTPGPDLRQFASGLGDTETLLEGKGVKERLVQAGELLQQLYRDVLYSHGDYRVPITGKGGRKRSLTVVSGHRWGDPENQCQGPHRTTVMIIGKMLGEMEKNRGRNLVGPSGQLLMDTCHDLGVRGIGLWYVTNLLKTEHPDAATGETTLRIPMIKEWLPLLHQELRIVRPDYILCLGADASKALMGKQASVTWMEGRVVEYEYPISPEAGPEGQVVNHKALVMTCLHPAWVLRTPEATDQFVNQVARFAQLASGNRWDQEEEGLDHRVIDSFDELKDLYHEIQLGCEDNLLGLDAEWHGEHPQNEGAYLRSIQISWKHKTAVTINLRKPGGRWGFQGRSRLAVAHWVTKICRGRRLAMHFGNADMEWLVNFGIDLREQFTVADTWQETMAQALSSRKPRGGIDTGLAAHAANETDNYSLTSLLLRHTSAPRYDQKLVAWKDAYCNKHKLKKGDLEGYGECPEEILYGEPIEGQPGRVKNSYSGYDADVCRRLVVPFQKLMNQDRFGNNCWEAFWMNMRAVPAVYEMNTTGILIDRDRLHMLTETYVTAKGKLEQRIRDWARWPEFNLQSVYQVREFLFGEKYNGKKREMDGKVVRLRPKRGRSLKLSPLLTTDKRPMPWSEVVRRGLLDQKTASTDSTTLGILAQESQGVRRPSSRDRTKFTRYDFSSQVNWVRDYRFISKVLQHTLRTPKTDAETKDFILDKDGYYVYPGGLPAAICDDGRVRTHLYQTKETGRWASARPPCHNLSKRREADYKRILKEDYVYPIRTIMTVPPGHLLIEADYAGIELAGMAIMSGDKRMIEHTRRTALPESHPDYYDIHSHVAVLAFGLKCSPTKGGLESVGMKHMRILAKSVIFGIAYGRGAKAIALAAKEEGVWISVEDAQEVIDTIFKLYPKLIPFFAECRERTKHPRWLCGCYGRFRRFPVAREWATQGEFERQAMNFPIQGMAADMVSRAVDHLCCYRKENPSIVYKMLLQMHDAVLFEVPIPHVPRFIDEVLPECMVRRVPIYPTTLSGAPTERGPYYLGLGIDPHTHWGEQLFPDRCMQLGLDPKYCHWEKRDDGFINPEFENKLWVGGETGGELVNLAAI